MRLGFTGTREGMSQAQYDGVEIFIIENAGNITEAHHGDCVGADAEFDKLIRLHRPDLTVDIHPPVKDKYRAWCQSAMSRIAGTKDYYARNRDIVLACDWLLAAPKEGIETGGTWYTVAWAEDMKLAGIKPNLNILLLLPDGRQLLNGVDRD